MKLNFRRKSVICSVLLSAWAIAAVGQVPAARCQAADKVADGASQSSRAADAEVTPVPDSFDQEVATAKRQLEESAPAKDDLDPLPPSGQVLTAAQKQAAVKEVTTIYNQNQGGKYRIAKRKSDGTLSVALALGGGGARGAAHIGVLKVLQEHGIPIDYVVGNSMGAIVGGMYSAGVPLDDIQTHLEDLSLRKAYLPGGVASKIATLPIHKLLHPFAPKHYAGLWSGKKLTNYLDSVLPRPNMEVSDTKIPFSCVATNLLDGKAYRINSGRLSTAIKASSAISGLIQPVAIGDKVFIDGGIRVNLPAAAAKDTGAGLVVADLIDEPLRVEPAKDFVHLKNIASRTSDIIVAMADQRQVQFADIVINPDVSDIPVFSNNPNDVKKAIKAGELAALKALPQLRQRLNLPLQAAKPSDSDTR